MAYETPQELVAALQSLTGEDRLDASAVKNLPTPRTDQEIQALIDTSDLNATQTASVNTIVSGAVRTDEEIQSLIDASDLNPTQTTTVDTKISAAVRTDEDIVAVVQEQLIDDTSIATDSLWSSEKTGQHIYVTPALYNKPTISSFSIDLEPSQEADVTISGSRRATYSVCASTNIIALSLFQDDTLITGNVNHNCAYHEILSFTIPDFSLSAGESTVFKLKGTDTLQQEFESTYTITGE